MQKITVRANSAKEAHEKLQALAVLGATKTEVAAFGTWIDEDDELIFANGITVQKLGSKRVTLNVSSIDRHGNHGRVDIRCVPFEETQGRAGYLFITAYLE